MTQRARVMLAVHLRDNGLAGEGLVETARKVVNAANKGRYNELIPLPKDIMHLGRSVLPVRDLIAILHLDQFLNGGYEEYYA